MRLQRNRLADQAVGIAAAVVTLVVAQRDGRAHLDETALAAAQQLVPDARMATHDRRFPAR